MTDHLLNLSDDHFTTLGNQAHSLDEAAERVREVAGKVPRWAVLARASALRRKGVELRRHELRGRAGRAGRPVVAAVPVGNPAVSLPVALTAAAASQRAAPSPAHPPRTPESAVAEQSISSAVRTIPSGNINLPPARRSRPRRHAAVHRGRWPHRMPATGSRVYENAPSRPPRSPPWHPTHWRALRTAPTNR